MCPEAPGPTAAAEEHERGKPPRRGEPTDEQQRLRFLESCQGQAGDQDPAGRRGPGGGSRGTQEKLERGHGAWGTRQEIVASENARGEGGRAGQPRGARSCSQEPGDGDWRQSEAGPTDPMMHKRPQQPCDETSWAQNEKCEETASRATQMEHRAKGSPPSTLPGRPAEPNRFCSRCPGPPRHRRNHSTRRHG